LGDSRIERVPEEGWRQRMQRMNNDILSLIRGSREAIVQSKDCIDEADQILGHPLNGQPTRRGL
jgi:hypothetical protein